ncbi:hypothetical protein CPB84DRAFT_1795968 [Gymnopilus junonius]|uniref:Uncharacterized protein n=1 Tax=Gymnopilus junonius TaxID=109634 RepID=A0A9P5N9B7_GYMJU|nr:hypothetical protein CPB84DRAFT_1795968 [Gymnopilus junonius]
MVDRFISSTHHKPEEQLEAVMMPSATSAKPFKQLDLLYSTIFEVVDSAKLPRTLHTLVFFSCFHPPDYICTRTPAFLERFLGLLTGDVRCLLLSLESLLQVGDDHEDIRIFHTSLSDYLFDKSRSQQFWIDAGSVYAEIAENGFQITLNHPSTELAFSKATPTIGLHEAIKNCNFSMNPVFRIYGYETTHLPTLLLAIRNLNFSDAKQLYRMKLTECLEHLPILQFLSKDPLLKLQFIIIIFLRPSGTIIPNTGDYIMEICTHLFGPWHANSKISQLEFEARSDDRGEYFLNGNEYADAALYLMKYLDEDTSYHDNLHKQLPRGPHVLVFEDQAAKAISCLLSRSAIRSDLIDYMDKHPLDKKFDFVRYDEVRNVQTEYRERAAPDPKTGRSSRACRGFISKLIKRLRFWERRNIL